MSMAAPNEKAPSIAELEKAASGSDGSVAVRAVPAIDPVAERRLVRKFDWILLPLFTVIYMANFIDRTAIGNARVAGLEQDLGMSGYDFNTAMTVFYVVYALSDIPSNLILKRVGSTWLAWLIIAFGLVALGSTFMKNFAGLIATRVFLGLAEGGTLAGLVYTLGQYYRRKELILRVTVFFGLGPSLSGAFGGLLASGMLRISDFGIIKTWRKILFVEGLLTIVIGIVLLFTMPDEVSKTSMLNEEERALAQARLDADLTHEGQVHVEKTTWKLIRLSFNVHTVCCTILFIILNISFQGLSIFLPTIVNGLGEYTRVEVQLRTVPPYLVGAAWAIISGVASFRFRTRCAPIFSSLALMVIGYAIAVGTTGPKVRYAACFLMIAGGGAGAPVVLTWGTENAAPATMRAMASALIPGIGCFGAIVSVWTYVPNDAPNYLRGNAANLGASSFACVLTVALMLYLRRENSERAKGRRDGILEGKTPAEIAQLGYRHPDFRYQL